MRNWITVSLLVATFAGPVASSEDWPTYSLDQRRSNVTAESLSLPLKESWHLQLAPPVTAWEGPAKWDAYSGKTDLKSMRNFDPAYFVTVVGDRLYFGSSVDDAAHCLDANTGETIWSYFTEGPVRFPPTWHDGRVYFGADDGHAYCVDASTGELVWKYKALVDDRYIPLNGKTISLAPVRTSVLVSGGTAYFAASLLPWRPSYLCAVDALTGEVAGEGRYRVEIEEGTFQGAILLSDEYLYALQGRSAPVVFARDTGKRRGSVSGTGGAFALLTDEDTFVSGAPSQKVDIIAETSTDKKRDQLASYPNANRMVVRQGIAYLQSGDELSAFDRASFLQLQGEINTRNKEREGLEKQLKTLREARKEAEEKKPSEEEKELAKSIRSLKKEVSDFTEELPNCFHWRVECTAPHSLILAGDTLYAGGEDYVVAYNTTDGQVAWQQAVHGAAHGLVVSNGKLFISTDEGSIYAFVPNAE